MFEVTRQGDMSSLKVPVDGGKFVYLPLFKSKPTDLKNGVREYRTRIPWKGEQVAVHYIESDKGASSLHIWPSEMQLTEGELTDALKEEFKSTAAKIAWDFHLFGGWDLGEPEFIGDLHHAVDDPIVMSAFGEFTGNIPGTNFWIDKSPGHGELETKDPVEMGKLINFAVNYKQTANEQSAKLESHEASIADFKKWRYEAEYKFDTFRELMDKAIVGAQKGIEFDTIMMESLVAERVQKLLESQKGQGDAQTAKASPANDNGVMYQ
jgi:hypothetical protein